MYFSRLNSMNFLQACKEEEETVCGLRAITRCRDYSNKIISEQKRRWNHYRLLGAA